MPLLKYYSFKRLSQVLSGTTYDGVRDFVFKSKKRFYPDEYLIATILKKYIKSRFSQESVSKVPVVILTEPWLSDNGLEQRKGDENTLALNQLILDAIETYRKQLDSTKQNTLILVPFLYRYHHPGVAIDIQKKLVIYLDPYGKKDSLYAEVEEFRKALKNVQPDFTFQIVSQEQQRRGFDHTSCGPILTASMIKFIEEFLITGSISVKKFERHKTILATDRMFQIYINNTIVSNDQTGTSVDEIMLANTDLWDEFFDEMELTKLTIKSGILEVVRKHRAYISSLALTWHESDDSSLRVQLIRNFQSRIIASLMLHDKEKIEEEITSYLAIGNQIVSSSQENLEGLSKQLYSTENVLSGDNYHKTMQRLHLAKPKSRLIPSITNQQLKSIIDSYQSTSCLSHCGFFNRYRSIGMKGLVKLCQQNKKIVTQLQVENCLRQDSEHRLRLFTQVKEKPNNTGTDAVIQELRAAFAAKNTVIERTF